MSFEPKPFVLPETQGAEPKYEQLHRYLLRRVSEGDLQPGQALPTEVQLAERLSISRTTVRQALARLERHGLVQRVRGKGTFISEDAASRLPAATSGAQLGLGLYGLVLPEIRPVFYPSLQQSFSEVARLAHHQTITCHTGQDLLKQADTMLQLLDRGVAGVAIVPVSGATTPVHQIRPLQASGIPVVFCHRPVEGVQAPLVTFSGVEVGRRAGRAMLERGHRRIAFFGTHQSTMSALYLRGLREALEDAGVVLPDARVYHGIRQSDTVPEAHEEAVRAKLKQLMAGPDRPTAILASYDPEAELLYLLLGRMGLRVPQDVSLVGVGGAWREGAMMRQLTSVTIDAETLGRRAAEVLDEMTRGDRPIDDNETLTVPLGMNDGRTLGAVPGGR